MEIDWIYAGLVVVAIFIFFMAGREIANWYFKIDKRVKLQEETNELLKKLLNK